MIFYGDASASRVAEAVNAPSTYTPSVRSPDYCPPNAKCLPPEARAALEKERELRPMQLPGTQTVSTDAPASQGAETPAWVWPVTLAVAGFLVTFAFTRKG
jgi:hypothetical protein